jgi:hydroxymethylpyrimidine pyrophosphatase-like HAD family hydrolase
MHLSVLACDLDGTLAENGEVAPETWDALRQAKSAGLPLILVSGRPLDSFAADGPYYELFEAIVAEDGAVVYFPRRDMITFPFGNLRQEFVQRLEERDVPLEHGTVIVATHTPHDEAVFDVLQKLGGGVTVEYNRGAVMVLPPGATKGSGLAYALRELGYSPRNVVACGDAENDRSLFEMAELAVAVANVVPEVRDKADVVLSEANGAGVRRLIADLLNGRIPPRRPRPDRRLLVGYTLEAVPVYLDPFLLVGGNLGIFGASRSGKSWLAGLLAEGLLRQGYQVLLVDPEGDYRGLRAFPHTLLMGGPEAELPLVVDLIKFSEFDGVSLVVDLSSYAVERRTAFVQELMHALRGLRHRRGRPHWFLMDEAQHFCPPGDGELNNLVLAMMREGGFVLVSYRPSQIASALLSQLDHCMLTRLSLPEDIHAVKSLLNGNDGVSKVISQLPDLPVGQAYLCLGAGSNEGDSTHHQGIIALRTGPRAIPHVRHLHKYLRAPLPSSKRFYFHDSSGRYLNQAAASLWEFREALGELPIDSIQYHLQQGDFECWLQDVLHDDDLASRVRKIHHRDLEGEELRQALLEVVGDRYEELDSLI